MSIQTNPKIETWFPKLIYIADNVCIDIVDKLESKIKQSDHKKVRTKNFNVDSTHLTSRSIHKNKTFFPLVTEIEHHSKIFLECMGYETQYTSNCRIENMWYNISDKDDFLFPHTHPGCILSGAFYVKTVKENEIIFYDDLTNPYEPPTAVTNLSMTTCKYSCIPGRLLLFRSNFLHATPKQLEEGEKIVISFNINNITH